MRWERLFADLEAEFEAADDRELSAEVAERTRSTRARLRLVDRLRGSLGRRVAMTLLGGSAARGTLAAVGKDWSYLRTDASRGGGSLVSLAAVIEVSGLTSASAEPGSEPAVDAATTFALALRRLARERARVVLELVDGTTLRSRVEYVGVDLVEVTPTPLDNEDRPARPEGRTVALAAIAMVRQA